MQTKDFKVLDSIGDKKMNIAEHRLTLFHQLEKLSEESLIEVEKLIAQLRINQKNDDISDLGGFFKNNKIVLTDEELCKPIDFKGVWLGIEKWREQTQFQENDEKLTDEMVASWRDKSSGRDFSWNS